MSSLDKKFRRSPRNQDLLMKDYPSHSGREAYIADVKFLLDVDELSDEELDNVYLNFNNDKSDNETMDDIINART